MTTLQTTISLPHAWTEGVDWAHANPQCSRDQYEARVQAYTAAWGPKVGYHFRQAILCALRVIRNAEKAAVSFQQAAE